MADKKDVARAILAFFKEQNSRAGHVIRNNQFAGLQSRHRWSSADADAGLQYAGDQGWIENGGPGAIRLTQAGAEAGGVTAPTPEEVARAILGYFKATVDGREGAVVQASNLVGLAANAGWTADERNAGLEFAEARGWIEGTGSSGIKLTKSGSDAL